MLAHIWQTIPERGVVRLRKTFECWWALKKLTISLERLILSGAVSLSGQSVW